MSSEIRLEIQGLRGLAVGSVVIFHLWPTALPGGYVGVDVFFVISGFLITRLLARDIEERGKLRLRRFYGGRIRRLLPAAGVVLLATSLALPLLPESRWEDTRAEIVASALYFQNWLLAERAVDYLASETAASPLQHFWSLAVEEQYYLAWPLLLALASRFRPRVIDWQRSFASLMVTVGVCSLAWSVYYTSRVPEYAYFATPSRAWELAAGGVLAITLAWQQLGSAARGLLGWLGLASIAYSAARFGLDTPFPGYHAMVPVLGAMALIMSGGPGPRWGPYPLLASPPLQWLGNLSYSLYLWHWPVIVFQRHLLPREPTGWDALGALAVSLILATASKALVEDPARRLRLDAWRGWLPYTAGIVAIALPLGSTVLVTWATASQAITAGITADSNFPGALAFTDKAAFDASIPFAPTALEAPEDKGEPYKDRCISRIRESEVRECQYGDAESSRIWVVVGDSHAVHWVPAFKIIAEQRGVRLVAITKSACSFRILKPKAGLDDQAESCLTWNAKALERVQALKPEMVVLAESDASLKKFPLEDRVHGSLETFRMLRETGASVVAIRATPRFKLAPADCMSRPGASIDTCTIPIRRALPREDALSTAARKDGQVRLIDLTHALCSSASCPPVVGNIFVWRDNHHLTASFVRSLAVPLERALGEPTPHESRTAPAARLLDPRQAKDDLPDAYRRGCHLDQRATAPKPCVYAASGAKRTVMLVGDSHAAQWIPALASIAEQEQWRLITHTKSACAFITTGTVTTSRGTPYEACRAWAMAVTREVLADRPDILLVGQSRKYRLLTNSSISGGEPTLAEQLALTLAPLKAAGIPMALLADTPRPGFDVPDCVSSAARRGTGCTFTFNPEPQDPLVVVARSEHLPIIDLNDQICPNGTCPPISDQVLVWRDTHHLTATFARRLAPALSGQLAGILSPANAPSNPEPHH